MEPWPSLVKSGANTDTIKAPASGGKVPEIIPFGKTFEDCSGTNHSLVKEKKITNAAKAEKLTAENFQGVAEKLKHLYVEVGRAKFKNLPSANCALFACCTIGMPRPIPSSSGRVSGSSCST